LRVAIAKAIEAEIMAQGERRGNPTFNKNAIVPDPAQLEPGIKTREIATQKAGFSSERIYRDTKTTVDKGTPELIAAMEKAKGTVLAGRDNIGGTKMEPPKETPTLAEQGITKKQSSAWQKVAIRYKKRLFEAAGYLTFGIIKRAL
jgi:hypothetical protein